MTPPLSAAGRAATAALLLAGVDRATALQLPPGDDINATFASGAVVGVRAASTNLRYWLGVPYAASTAGALAFAPPQPRAPWQGTLDCRSWGAGCLQTHHNPDVPTNQSYDCLNVNIFTPDLAPDAAPVPVMVFFNGGAYLEGSNQGPFGIYSGLHFASEQGVIVVSADYRLGPFGWMYAPPAAQGNMGLLDMVAALQWVKANIAAVGGDPTAVTVFGESAGAMSIGALMTMPSAQGLFHRAIMESNVAGFNYKNTSEAVVYGNTACGLLNCSLPGNGGCNGTCMTSYGPQQVMDAWNTATGNVGDFIITNLPHILDGLLGTGPVVDGQVLPMEPLAAVESGTYWAAGMPVLLGTNSNEGETFIYDAVTFALPGFLIPLGYTALLDWNETAAKLVDAQPRYNSSAYADGRDPLSHVVTDYWFRCASERFLMGAYNHASAQARATVASAAGKGVRGATATASSRQQQERLASGSPGVTWAYRYAHVYSNSSIFPTFGLPKICATAVCHASELPFVFHNVPSFTSFTPEEDVLAGSMTTYWANFAKTGNPNTGSSSSGASSSGLNPRTGAPLYPWPAWDPSTRTSLVLDLDMSVESTSGMCGFWDSVGGYFF